MAENKRLQLLPALFAKKSKGIDLKSIHIKLRSSKFQNRCRVNCTLYWTETAIGPETRENSSVSDSTVSSKSSRKSSTKSTSKSSRKTIKRGKDCICKQPKEEDIVQRKCEGNCGRTLPVKQLFLMGQCEHAVCSRCLECAPRVENCFGVLGCPNPECYELDLAVLCLECAPRVENCFGVLGCPNPECYELDLAVLCPDKSKRMAQIRKVYHLPTKSTTSEVSCQTPMTIPSSRSSSSTSYLNLNAQSRLATPEDRICAKKVVHTVSVNLAIFRDAKDGSPFLQKSLFEFPSTISIGAALKSCVSESAELSSQDLNNRCYVGPTSFIKVLDRENWKPINLDDDEPLYNLEDDDMRVMLIIDLIGLGQLKSKSRKSKRQK
uniref:Uncharacterized protein n=1 Tax=Panagrolaimus sp. JU765 TaxID=591449 RepID=A0AC34QZA2_9BILA